MLEDLGKLACELEWCLKCVCHTPDAWDLAGLEPPRKTLHTQWIYDLLHLSEMLHHSTILALLENYSVPHNLLFKPHRQSLHKVVGRNVLHCYSTKRHLKWKQRCTFTSTTPENNKVTDTERNLANKKSYQHSAILPWEEESTWKLRMRNRIPEKLCGDSTLSLS